MKKEKLKEKTAREEDRKETTGAVHQVYRTGICGVEINAKYVNLRLRPDVSETYECVIGRKRCVQPWRV